MRLFGYIRILPLLVLVSLLSFVVRVGDFVDGMSHSGQAFALEEVKAEPPAMPAHETAQNMTDEHGGEPDLPGLTAMEKKDEGEPVKWQDAGDAAFEYSEVKAELYQDLMARRQQIEEREKALMMKEALMEAGERELDQKLRELTAIKNEIESLLQEQSAEEQARIESLVKIYEGMKAKDAASIFNTLDIDVLIQIMARMSERKSAPILAEMSPERARSVTILLAEQKHLPDVASY